MFCNFSTIQRIPARRVGGRRKIKKKTDVTVTELSIGIIFHPKSKKIGKSFHFDNKTRPNGAAKGHGR